MADKHYLDEQGVEFEILPAEPERPERTYTEADFTITDPDWVKNRCLAAIETLATSQDQQTEGGRAHNLWPRASMAYQIAAGGGIDPEYVTDRFTETAYRNGMDTDVKNGGMRNVEVQLRRAYAKAVQNGPKPPPTPGEDLCGTAFQFDPDDLLTGHVGADTPEHSEAAEPPRAALEAIENGFWEARPSLALIYTAALSRLASPWAVLACCVARVLARVPPELKLPPIIGGPGSLNWFAAITAKSGGGKGAAMAVAEQLVRGDDILVRGIGSGEGMIECYGRRRPHKDESMEEAMADWVISVLFNIEEVDSLGAMNGRTGQTTMAILRQGFSGEKLGYSYRGRQGEVVDAHTYRMTVVASVQPERAGVLFDDSGGGTPQRFMWFPARDKRITMDAPAWPDDPQFGPKYLSVPSPVHDGPYVEVPAVAVSAIREARVRSMQGDDNALDGHALFCREKFAYALALMDGRTAISEGDWELSGVAAEVSDWCRTKAQQGYAGGKERASREKGSLRALEDDERNMVLSEVTGRALTRVSGLVLEYLKTDGPLSSGDINRRLASRDRPRLKTVLSALELDGFITKEGRLWSLTS